jgi:hypothetical protein
MKKGIKDVCAALSALKNDILLYTHICMKKFNLFLLYYGSILHTIFLICILVYLEITPKTPMFWAFLLNHIMFAYFVFVRGCALGIRQTINIIEQENAEKAIQEELNKNN